MGIPKRIRDESAAADTALQQLADAQRNPAPANDDPPVGDPVVAAAPDLTPNPAPTPVVTAAPITPETHEVLLQQYRTLQGQFTRQNAIIADMEARLTQLATPAAPKPTAPTPLALLSAKEREEYGDEFVVVVQKAAREAIEPLIARVTGRLERLETSMRDVAPKIETAHNLAAQTQEDRFFAQLSAALPDWEAVNLEPALLDWLTKTDKLSGSTYRAMLDKASAELNAERVAAVFTTYLTEQGRSPGAQTAQPTNRPPVDPASLVSPSTSASRPPNANPQQGVVLSMAEIDEMYRKKRRGQYTPQEWVDVEAKINRAMTEGRIRE